MRVRVQDCDQAVELIRRHGVVRLKLRKPQPAGLSCRWLVGRSRSTLLEPPQRCGCVIPDTGGD